MKLPTSSTTSALTNAGDSQTFQISANGTAFKILSSGLYSNKIAAVIRELSCNAVDAHTAAGVSNEPIEVHLPHPGSLFFKVKDHGNGMSHEQVMALYTTYFSSDKRASNAFIGGLGLGSKSPFAYTDSFTVTSVHQGVKRVYICMMDEQGMPTVSLLQQVATKEHAGVEVQLQVQPKDVDSFRLSAAAIYHMFGVKPKTNVDISEAMSKHPLGDVRFAATGYKLFSKQWSAQSVYVRMGNVLYPVDHNYIEKNSLGAALTKMFYMELLAPVGMLQVAASREALQYDPDTVKALRLLLDQAVVDFIRAWGDAPAQYGSKVTTWQKEMSIAQWIAAICPYGRYNDYSQQVKDFAEAVRHVRPEVSTYATYYAQKGLLAPRLTAVTPEYSVYFFPEGAAGRKVLSDGNISVGKNSERANVHYHEDTAIVLVDTSDATERLNNWRKDKNLPAILQVVPSSKKHLAVAEEAVRKWSAALGDMPMRKLSEMTTAVTKTANKKVYVEIDERLVNYRDMLTGALKVIRLSDVPSDQRYMLVKNTQAREDFFFATNAMTRSDTFVPPQVQQHQIGDFHTMVQWLQGRHSKPWTGPTGYIEVRPVDVTRLQLEQKGYQAVIQAFVEHVRQPAQKAWLTELTNTVSMEGNLHYIGGNRHYGFTYSLVCFLAFVQSNHALTSQAAALNALVTSHSALDAQVKNVVRFLRLCATNKNAAHQERVVQLTFMAFSQLCIEDPAFTPQVLNDNTMATWSATHYPISKNVNYVELMNNIKSPWTPALQNFWTSVLHYEP